MILLNNRHNTVSMCHAQR